ncbi:hypothetical protein KIN20_025606 [Parelaphostrongylus tenuis]|uniref:Uncharacterized protein n=1 Tax=Parelaphostrongylus tenuis TaxID=148309 RepID=A0AAD5QXT2_PARTN|nr:hypothetical protein KIN20_025606 [Parelaphostrongylus tenuis]
MQRDQLLVWLDRPFTHYQSTVDFVPNSQFSGLCRLQRFISPAPSKLAFVMLVAAHMEPSSSPRLSRKSTATFYGTQQPGYLRDCKESRSTGNLRRLKRRRNKELNA